MCPMGKKVFVHVQQNMFFQVYQSRQLHTQVTTTDLVFTWSKHQHSGEIQEGSAFNKVGSGQTYGARMTLCKQAFLKTCCHLFAFNLVITRKSSENQWENFLGQESIFCQISIFAPKMVIFLRKLQFGFRRENSKFKYGRH